MPCIRARWIFTLIFVTSPVNAKTPSPQAEAARHLQEGAHRLAEHEAAAALDEFSRADALSHSPQSGAQIAIAEAALGRWAVAETHLQAAIAAEEDPWIRRHRAQLEQALAVIDQHLASVEITVDAQGATLSIGGAASAPLEGRPLRLPAGDLTLLVKAPGCEPETRRIAVKAGTSRREHFTLRRITVAQAPPPPPPPPPPAPDHKLPIVPDPAAPPPAAKPRARWPLWVGIAGSVVVVGAAAATMGVLASRSSEPVLPQQDAR